MNNRTFVDHNLSLVPFAIRMLVLRNSRYHVIQRSGLAVVVLSQFRVGVIGIIQHLIFRSGNVNRLEHLIPVFILRCHFLSQIQDTGISALRDFPFQKQFKVLELMSENQIAAIAVLRFTAARAIELDASVFDNPTGRHLVFSIATPSVECLSVKNGNVSVFIDRKLQTVCFGSLQR